MQLFTLLSSAVVASLFFASCGNGDKEANKKDDAPPTKETPTKSDPAAATENAIAAFKAQLESKGIVKQVRMIDDSKDEEGNDISFPALFEILKELKTDMSTISLENLPPDLKEAAITVNTAFTKMAEQIDKCPYPETLAFKGDEDIKNWLKEKEKDPGFGDTFTSSMHTWNEELNAIGATLKDVGEVFAKYDIDIAFNSAKENAESPL